MRSDVVGLFDGPIRLYTTRVVDVLRFEQENPNLFVRHWAVLHPLGHHDDFSRSNGHFAVAEFHDHAAPDHMEQFVLVIVGVPQKFTLDLGEFHILTIELGDDFWGPLFVEQSKFLVERNGMHGLKVGPRSQRIFAP